MIKRELYLSDTTLRDGEQRPGLVFDDEQKCRLALLLDRAGVQQIDAGIPAMGIEEQRVITRILKNRVRTEISVWNRMDEKDIRMAMECEPDIIHISAPASYVHIYSKLKKNKNWLVTNLMRCVSLARDKGFAVTVGFEDASRADMTFLTGLSRRLAELDVSRVQFSDTVGVLTPGRTFECVAELIRVGGLPVSFHGHNDLGFAVANAIAAARAGAEAVETTLLGLGERAGNCNMTAFIRAASTAFTMRPAIHDCTVIEKQARAILFDDGKTVQNTT